MGETQYQTSPQGLREDARLHGFEVQARLESAASRLRETWNDMKVALQEQQMADDKLLRADRRDSEPWSGRDRRRRERRAS